MPVIESKYSIVIDNISSATRTNDLWVRLCVGGWCAEQIVLMLLPTQRELEDFGAVYEVEVDRPTRSAIAEFKRYVVCG